MAMLNKPEGRHNQPEKKKILYSLIWTCTERHWDVANGTGGLKPSILVLGDLISVYKFAGISTPSIWEASLRTILGSSTPESMANHRCQPPRELTLHRLGKLFTYGTYRNHFFQTEGPLKKFDSSGAIPICSAHLVTSNSPSALRQPVMLGPP